MENNGMEKVNNQKTEHAGDKEMMQMPDGTMADVTNMSPEERRELVESYEQK